MNKDFSVQELIEKYNETIGKNTTIIKNGKNEKEIFLKKYIKVEDYLDFNLKMILAKKIVENSSYAIEPIIKNGQIEKDDNDQIKYERTNKIKIDSNNRYVMFVYTVLEYYTNIIMDSGNILGQFDMLNKIGLVDEIIKMIPEKEMIEFNTVVDQTFNDFITNNYEIHTYISNQIQRVIDVLGVISQPLIERFMSMSDEEIGKIIEKISKFVIKDNVNS